MEKRLKRIADNSNIDVSKDFIIICEEIAKLDKINYNQDKDFKLEDTIRIISELLNKINPLYNHVFENALGEEDEDKPIIYVYNSREDLDTNESICNYNQLSLYKRNTIDDVYILFHELTHLLTNINLKMYEGFEYDKKYREIPSIIGEFILNDRLNEMGINNYNYLFSRFNTLRNDCISLLIKNKIVELNKANNLSEKALFDYLYSLGLNDEDINRQLDMFIGNDKVDIDEEYKYIYGLLYGYKLYKEEPIKNYNMTINKMVNKTISLEDLPLEESLKIVSSYYDELKKLTVKKEK